MCINRKWKWTFFLVGQNYYDVHLTLNVPVDHSKICIYRFWLYSSQYIGTGVFFLVRR